LEETVWRGWPGGVRERREEDKGMKQRTGVKSREKSETPSHFVWWSFLFWGGGGFLVKKNPM